MWSSGRAVSQPPRNAAQEYEFDQDIEKLVF